ncbi:protease [Agaricicola taiwanensis]|uniref:Protease n=1 Tax=Agaricicola taiwanensis TaxID=591372 RepID=A0A8J2VRB3_9RHOB|nr:type 1 glutamine amidotransferase domain-containing protein [Agaricicola taiwanensis]GGE37730.1 protease [Agaricicola taiwanensis]
MAHDLKGKRVAILATNGFEQSELLEPLKALKQANATTEVVSLEKGQIKGWNEKDWGDSVDVDKVISEVSASDYDAIVLPGGQINPDVLRTSAEIVDFVRQIYKAKKPIGAICHGPWVLIEAGVVKGLEATSYKSIKTDMINAGAKWVDQEVVVDDGIITSRNPNDLPAFCAKLIEEIAEGRHPQRQVA